MKLFTDEELIKTIRSGSIREINEATAYLYRVLYPSIRNFVVKRGMTLEDSKDLFQDITAVFFVNVRSGKFLLGSAKISTYFHSVANNMLLKQKRRRSNPTLTDDIDYSEERDIWEKYTVHEEHQMLTKALNGLSGRCQQILRLRFFEGLSHKEIAGKLGVEVASVKNQQCRCVIALKKKLQENRSV